MIAAKWAMLVLSLGVPLLAWSAARSFITPFPRRVLAAVSLSFVTLFTIAATQLYPDLLAGMLLGYVALAVTARRLGEDRTTGPWTEAALVAALSVVPWLHMRLAAPVVLCAVARFLLLRQRRGEKLAWILAPVASLLILALYNYYAFDRFSGPYVEGKALEFSPTALMVLFGLQVDQFQGIFVHAPILLCALVGFGALARRDWRLAGFLILLYGSLVVPNAMHPNWYGGGSFAGRFVLAGGVVLLVPAAYGLAQIFAARPCLGGSFCGVHLLVEGFLWYRYAVDQIPIFNQSADREIEEYLTAWAPHQYTLPALFRLDDALHHWPNFAWVVVLILLLATGWSWRRRGEMFLALAGVTIMAGGLAGAVERPVWEIVEPKDIADLSLGLRDVRILYGDPSEGTAAMTLARQLRHGGAKPCLDPPTLLDFPFSPDQTCPEAVPAGSYSRVVLAQSGGWKVRALRAARSPSTLDLDFSKSADRVWLGKGWSTAESWGVWSVGSESDLHLDKGALTGMLRLDVDLSAFLTPQTPEVVVPVSVNGVPLAIWTFREAANRSVRSVWIPAEVAALSGQLTVNFAPPGKVVPGQSETRPLGVGIYGLTLQED